MRIHRLAAALAGVVLHVAVVSTHSFDARVASLDAGLIVVPVHLDGTGPHRFVVDTGATTSTVDRDFAARLGLVSSGEVRIVTTAGSAASPTAVVNDLRIGDYRIGAVRAAIMPLDALAAMAEGIAGVLGQDVLSRTTLVIDYRRGRVRMADITCEPGDASLATARADGRPMIPAHVAGAGTGAQQLVIDSAANGLILFARRAHAGSATVSTHTGVAAASIVKAANIRIADFAFRQPAYVVTPPEDRIEDGLLPASWFSRICLDGPRNMVVLNK